MSAKLCGHGEAAVDRADRLVDLVPTHYYAIEEVDGSRVVMPGESQRRGSRGQLASGS
jgi:hypothetical protein